MKQTRRDFLLNTSKLGIGGMIAFSAFGKLLGDKLLKNNSILTGRKKMA